MRYVTQYARTRTRCHKLFIVLEQNVGPAKLSLLFVPSRHCPGEKIRLSFLTPWPVGMVYGIQACRGFIYRQELYVYDRERVLNFHTNLLSFCARISDFNILISTFGHK